ncbi:MAG: hypothetical protein AAFU85_10785 [Planctomycetota bacterium]
MIDQFELLFSKSFRPHDINSLLYYSTSELRSLKRDLDREAQQVYQMLRHPQEDVWTERLREQQLKLIDQSNKIAGELARRSEMQRSQSKN